MTSINLTELEKRRLALFNQGHTIEEIAKMENSTFSGIQTTIWRAKAKLAGTYKAPARNEGSTKKSGIQFKPEWMEKIDFIKKCYIEYYQTELTDEELIEKSIRALFSETYDDMANRERIKREKEEADRIRAEREAREAEEARERANKERADREAREEFQREKAEREKAEKSKKSKKADTTKRKRGFKYFTGYEANTKEIKSAFRTLSKMLHPDNLETGDNDSFIEMKREYDKLMNM
jgi:hypothetical protein